MFENNGNSEERKRVFRNVEEIETIKKRIKPISPKEFEKQVKELELNTFEYLEEWYDIFEVDNDKEKLLNSVIHEFKEFYFLLTLKGIALEKYCDINKNK